jgi:predicted site-specific integrase-resolvase
MYNLASAAAATGVNRSTVLRAIKAGRLSAQRDEQGGWQIDPAELHRVFRRCLPPQPARR